MSDRKERLQLEFTPDGMQGIDELGEEAGNLSRSATVRDALDVYYKFLKITSPQSIVEVIDEGEVTSRFRAMLFRNVIS